MTVLPSGPPDPAENWDEDFEFNVARNSSSDARPDTRLQQSHGPAPSTPLSKDRKNTLRLKRWSESQHTPSVPSTPSKRTSTSSSVPRVLLPENWDDDFRDNTDSPVPHRSPPDTEPGAGAEPHENWDEDFAASGTSPKGKVPARRGASWGSSDEENEEDDYGLGKSDLEDRTVTSRSRPVPLHLPHDPPPPIPPLPLPFQRSPTASVFSMPSTAAGHSAHDYSSTAHLALRPSVSAGSSALALLPPSPPIHRERERRRLRKKSRPPGAVGHVALAEDVYEMDDIPRPPSTPEKKAGFPLPASLDEPPPLDAQPSSSTSTAPSTTKTPLLSRIGSVGRKWGARKKRASTGPSEVTLHEDAHDLDYQPPSSRPQSVMATASPSYASKSSWFFRAGGAGNGAAVGSPPKHASPLKHETSVDRLLAMAGLDHTPDSPSRTGRSNGRLCNGTENVSIGSQDDSFGTHATNGDALPSSILFLGSASGTARRPTSMQIQLSSSNSSSHSGSTSSWSRNRPPVPRHASYGHDLGHAGRKSGTTTGVSSRASSASRQRSASASVEDVSRPQQKGGGTGRDERSGEGIRGHRRRPTDIIGQRNDAGEGDEFKNGPRDANKEKEQSGKRWGRMRRLSLVGSAGKHKRTKSSVPPDDRVRTAQAPDPLPLPRDDPDVEDSNDKTPRPPSRIVRRSADNALLPPIELQPPSPPRVPAGVGGEGSSPSPSDAAIDVLLRPHPMLEPSRSHPTLSTRSSDAATPAVVSRSSSSTSPHSSPLPSPAKPKPSSPPQAASLGRATVLQPQKDKDMVTVTGAVPRRNSLGDLKIPARISQAQVGLRRDLGMVKEFASSVEQLKQLQQMYHTLLSEVHALISTSSPHTTTRALSPTLFNLPRPASRARSNTNPNPSPPSARELSAALQYIEAKYQLSWECAELLVDLGSGTPAPPASAPTSPPASSESVLNSPITAAPTDGRKSRERAVTLAGDEPKPNLSTPMVAGSLVSPPVASPPTSAQWRASTGRHDLSQRQLLILREMLNYPDSSATIMSLEPHIPEDDAVDRKWRWGDAMNSTITLPSEESTHASGSGDQHGKPQKRRSSRLGMRGLRDMLRSLKRTYADHPSVPQSTTSIAVSTNSSLNGNNLSCDPMGKPLPQPHTQAQSLVQRRRAKTSTGPESIKSNRDRHPNSPYGTSVSLTHRASPRRPSLASIFRIGQKSRSAQAGTESSTGDFRHTGLSPSSSGSGHVDGPRFAEAEEEDWDRVDAILDLEHTAKILDVTVDGAATVRGKKGKSPYLTQHHQDDHPMTPKRSPSASQSSIWSAEPSPRKTAFQHQTDSSSPRAKLSSLRQLTEKTTHHQTRPPSRGKDRTSAPSPKPKRPPSRSRGKGGPSGSVRSVPPHSLVNRSPDLPMSALPDVKLAMTPENIRPLLENAREVHARCSECIVELRALLPVEPRS
ncbi:hypothetical protein AcW1_003305 [Taiwanofungus camphoratus]|nr:hypothetical protein AcW1_003305 [Antrodia cinnamomea]